MEQNSHNEYSNALPKGAMLYEFEIDCVLGAGGFGITYKAKDTNLDTYMVIKEYMPSSFASRSHYTTVTCVPKEQETFERGKQKFLEEAKVLKKFDNIFIVKTHRYFEANGTAYFVMDFYDGETLGEYFEKNPNRHYTQDEILTIMMPIIEGLKVVHEKGVLHRDIAPDNIFLRRDRSPVIIDFGASKNAFGTQTQNIAAVIKHGYSPPEQYTPNSKQDETTDLYAICAVLYEFITGQKPPESSYRQTQIFNTEDDPLENIVQKYKGKYHQSFLATIHKGLSLRQKERVQTIKELQKGLMEGMDGDGGGGALQTIAISLGVVLLFGLGLFLFIDSPAPTPLVDEKVVTTPQKKDVITPPSTPPIAISVPIQATPPISSQSVVETIWQDTLEVEQNKMSWEEAKVYCESLRLEGMRWQLPAYMDFKKNTKIFDYNSVMGRYWAEEIPLSVQSKVFNQKNGTSERVPRTQKMSVRCLTKTNQKEKK